MKIGNFIRSKYSFLVLVPIIITELVVMVRLFMIGDKFVLVKPPPKLDKHVWALYVPSYANPQTDKYKDNWQSWNTSSAKNDPEANIPSRVLPQLGLYSSHDKVVVKTHLRMMSRSGIDGIVVEYKPKSEDRGFIEESMKIIFKQAKKIGLTICFQIQNYNGRDNQTLIRDLNWIKSNYAYNELYATYNAKPIVFIYDPHNVMDIDYTLSKFQDTFFLIGSIAERSHLSLTLEAGFHGIFTHFASENFTWSSSPNNWLSIANNCAKRDLLFVPAVAPGYDDRLTSRWNARLYRPREGGNYYRRMFGQAKESGARVTVINSFNNWLEGTAIEPAMDYPDRPLNNDTWSTAGSDAYLDLTKELAADFRHKK